MPDQVRNDGGSLFSACTKAIKFSLKEGEKFKFEIGWYNAFLSLALDVEGQS